MPTQNTPNADQIQTGAASGAMRAISTFIDRLWNADDKTLRWVLGVLVLALACFNFLRDLNNPNHAFWDESYYLTSTERYIEHTAQYASHPPLGFMFMDLGTQIVGGNKGLATHPLAEVKKIDSRTLVNGYDFTGIRLLAAVFSVISTVLFYLIVLKLTDEAFEAFVFSLLFVFENAFIVHFRAAHLDPYQMTFTLGSILVWLYTFAREPKRPILTYAAFGLLCGLSFMVKVNSLVMLALGGFSLLHALWMERNRKAVLDGLVRGTAVAGAFAATVVAVFCLHTVLNPKAPDPNTEAGKRDLHYMTTRYQDWMNGKAPLSAGVLWDAGYGYYQYMKHDFDFEIKAEKNGSQPIEWPLMSKPISYRWDFDGKKTAYTQMVGNPVNWGLSIVGLIGAVVLILRRRSWKDTDLDHRDMGRLEVMFAMYMIFWWVHIYLGTQRVMYIYHYFIGLALSYMIVALVFRIVSRRYALVARHRFSILCAISLMIAGGFLFYSPLSYHYYLSREECELRNVPFTALICQPIKKK